ncbi:uncharacterized protein EDB91DRAFT_1001496, partial [Suillus paluster]|uniref:uncharacterized protein n=1 Tax=Suillus paluster TaxID=48578 RepID=UPI001B875B37
WDEVKVKITEKLAEHLKLKKPDLSDYELTFSVPRHQTSPIPLANEDDFNNLHEAAIKCKDPQAKVIIKAILKKVHQMRMGKENNVGSDDKDDGTDDDSADRPKKKKKSKKTPDELPLNIEVAAHVKTLRNWWVCNKAGCLSSGQCYIPPDNKEHFPLSHNHFQIWAAAMAKNPPLATVNQPPNHHAFDGLHDNQMAAKSPLLQR